ncbi:MAG: M4 family metallopeptidase [Holophagaceae bacterium]|nr:M4 family metallopeptidase [Holophagaceae bacterium]
MGHPAHHRRQRHRPFPVQRHRQPQCEQHHQRLRDERRGALHALQDLQLEPRHQWHRHHLYRRRQHLGRQRELCGGLFHHRRQRPDRRSRCALLAPGSFDFFKNVLGRNGIDGAGRAAYNRVHYSNNYDNAFWSDSCFCMTYGDGSSFTTLTALDVAAHEMSHGVCANEANLTYSGESGGLNESNSDIFGAVVEVYSRNGNSIPATVSNTDNGWKIGEQLNASPLRYMDKPSKDGSSKDAWYSGLGSIDVHYSSGPNNRMYFFLSQGSGTTSGPTTTAPTCLAA